MKRVLFSFGLVAVLLLASCAAGPHQLRRTVDDWDQQLYVENPLLDGVLWFVPVMPIAHMGAMLVDSLTVDAYHFWAKDLWDGKGTGYKHFEVPYTDGYMESLLIDGAKWFDVKK